MSQTAQRARLREAKFRIDNKFSLQSTRRIFPPEQGRGYWHHVQQYLHDNKHAGQTIV